MSFAAPIADPDAPLARRNPVAKLAAAIGLTLPLLATLDPVTPALVLVLELAVVPAFGVGYRMLVRRAWPVLFSALGAAAVQLIFGTSHVVESALGLGLRVLAVALPGVLVFATTDPTDLADALVQNLKAPARFAIGALAAFRLLPLLFDEWRMLTFARRARGIDAGRNPFAAVRLFASTLFALLVGAIRRGTRLATAMDARGFDSAVPRTAARRQRFTPADVALILGALAVAALALGTAVATGAFRPVL
jgi:energy-coupling factor transport system permease protein